MDKKPVLKQLEEEFQRLYKKYGELPIRKIETVTSQTMKKDLKKYGVFHIDDVVTEETFVENLKMIFKEMYFALFGTKSLNKNTAFVKEYRRIKKTYYPERTEVNKYTAMISTLTLWWNTKNGFGNSSFKFLYHQYSDNDPSIKVNGNPLSLSYNHYHKCNLRWLASYPKLWNLLKGMYSENDKPMVSWDSQKVRFYDNKKPTKYKPTKPTMTKRHRDIYERDSTKRLQAMLIKQNSEAIALGYVLFSHKPKIKNLINKYLGTPKTDFNIVEDVELNKIVDQYWRAPSNGFVTWYPYVIHYEGLPTENRKLKTTKQPISNLSKISFRAVIGTHLPQNLTQEELKQLAYWSEKGWQPQIYKHMHNNKSSKFYTNLMNLKSTRYLKSRIIPSHELQRFKNAKKDYRSYNETVVELPNIIKEMYGIYES